MKRLIISVATSLFLLLVLASPVFAIADPDSISINTIDAYQYLLEDGDMGVLVDFNVNYASVPDETITEAFLVALVGTDGTTILKAATPYTYVNSGYGRNLAWIYFDADTAPTWNQSYSIWVFGNPTIGWTGDPPKAVGSTISWSASTSQAATQVELAQRVLFKADQLELLWEVNLIDEVATGGSVLSTAGESLMVNIISKLRTMAPKAFSAGSTQATYEQPTYTVNPDNDLVISDNNTPLDLEDVGTATGIGEDVMKGGMWLIVSFIIVGVTVAYVPAGSKVSPVIFSGLMWMGARLGMVPFLAAGMLIALAALTLAFLLFYHPSSA